jgi:hypothetical protein
MTELEKFQKRFPFKAMAFSATAAVLTATAFVKYISANPPREGELELLLSAILVYLIVFLPICFLMVGMEMRLQETRIQALEAEKAERQAETG